MVAAVPLGSSIEISVSSQSIVFFQACLLGIILGLLYDIFRIIRRTVTLPYSFISAQDLLYIFSCVFFSFVFLLQTTDGRLIWFIAAGEVLGMTVYHLTVGAAVIKLFMKIISFIKEAFIIIFRIFIVPILNISDKITEKVKSAVKIRRKKFEKALVNRKKCLKQKGSLLYNSSISAIEKQSRHFYYVLARRRGNGKEKT